jgi:glycosyltransferase involved in cell wall biosynthesis
LTAESISVLQVCSAREAVYGAAQSLVTLAIAQRKAGTRVEFLTFKGKRFGQQVRDLGFTAAEVKVRGKVDPLAVVQMARVIRTGRFDVVHTHLSTSSVNGGLAARLARVPCLATVHGMSSKLSFLTVNQLIAVSNGVKDHLVRQGVSPSKVSVVYNGIDPVESKLTKPEARARLAMPEGSPVVGTVSRITALKGIEDAIRAVATMIRQFPSLRYLVVGDGDGLEPCKRLSEELGIGGSEDFTGYRTDVQDCLAAMDMFLFPSLKEAMGVALVEAMVAGLPCVATNVGGIPEVVTCDTGVLVDPNRPDLLARASIELLEDPARMTALGCAGRARAKELFSISAMETATNDVYRSMIR